MKLEQEAYARFLFFCYEKTTIKCASHLLLSIVCQTMIKECLDDYLLAATAA